MTHEEAKAYRTGLQRLGNESLSLRLGLAGMGQVRDEDKVKALCLEAASRLSAVKLGLR